MLFLQVLALYPRHFGNDELELSGELFDSRLPRLLKFGGKSFQKRVQALRYVSGRFNEVAAGIVLGELLEVFLTVVSRGEGL